jgi:hypothetical protein
MQVFGDQLNPQMQLFQPEALTMKPSLELLALDATDSKFSIFLAIEIHKINSLRILDRSQM